MERIGGRYRPWWWLVPAALLLMGGVLAITGAWDGAVACVLLGLLGLLVLPRLLAPAAVLDREIGADTAAEVRAAREGSGVVAAVRLLRTRHPELRLVDAVRVVQDL